MTLTERTLLLNASYEPLGIISWEKAIELLLGEKVYVLETYDRVVRSPSIAFKLPAVVALKRYIPIRPKVKFSRKHVYIRDEFTCQYCGVDAYDLPGKVKDLTFDHVKPKCQGGITSWENIVTACHWCNSLKAGRTPKEAGMKLLREPFEPKVLSMVSIPLGGRPSTPDEWRSYLYWETELEE